MQDRDDAANTQSELVSYLRQAIREGRYVVCPERLARVMRHMLRGSAADGELLVRLAQPVAHRAHKHLVDA